ncbi:hypothetical protein F0145_23440 [Adhaeribacter rhizoryzae]|uniref:Polymer-forming cytoskeletal protein n=1 Tax=Adhaeribacter rhizoryzae TaxID=2607907 RepID=A0A5M6CXJ7_9BACT|nr:hypothetical protein [Adhaeribacter rhizoryzae]KAA5539947.1 hypothetical protein F0145_23440 [Adhaeribacter rhizoryzae]
MKPFFKFFSLLLILSFTTSPVFSGDFQAGGKKTINRPVNEDLYVSRGAILVNARINGDLAAAGGTVTLKTRLVVMCSWVTTI